MNDRNTHRKPEDDGSTAEERRRAVRRRYGAIATGEAASCCAGTATAAETDRRRGADETGGCGCGGEDRNVSIPADADLGLGSGDPIEAAALRPGETVVDLGSGPGGDCLRAARYVGDAGRVIGVDATPEMVTLARTNAADAPNVEFRLGEMERLPIADASADVVVSNCAINLSPDKPRVFAEAYRVLEPGGRLVVSDIVRTVDPGEDDANGSEEETVEDSESRSATDVEAFTSCVAGAVPVDALAELLGDAGFVDVSVSPTDRRSTGGCGGGSRVPADVRARKPDVG